ncbi:MAG TPA: SDR family oxidoreductase [Candidatus Dormibacteraeota bacterium]|nr:SDR family oxidoreductase [Candidatus Dormibacteraeota bacterium]
MGDGRLAGRVALITGGGSGIGLAAVHAFAAEGARVVLAGRRAEVGEAAAAEVVAAGGDAHFVPADVSSSADVAALVDACVSRHGRLDCAFNCAAVGGQGALCADIEEEDFDRVVATNLKGVWLCMKYEIRAMLPRAGAIVNMSSIDGLTSSANAAAYSASKHGVEGLTRTAAVEYGAAGIRVNALAAGGFATEALARSHGHDLGWVEAYRSPAVPLGRLGDPVEAAVAAVWLCSEESAYVTGHTLVVDGGQLADSASYIPLRRLAPKS